MTKRILTCFLFFTTTYATMAGVPPVKTDTLLKILMQENSHTKVDQLIDYLGTRFRKLPLKSLDSAKRTELALFFKYDLENRQAFECLTESICQERLQHAAKAENELLKAISFAGKNEDHYLFSILLKDLAYKQTEEGNALGAISSYRMAKKEAVKMGDNYLQLVININISDVYYKNNYYVQALGYLNEAGLIISRFGKTDEKIKKHIKRIEIIIDYNKSEIFFRTNNPDSLKVYNKKLLNAKFEYYKLHTYQNRTSYYLYLLDHEYRKAIKLIKLMRHDTSYKFDNRDKISLADAYFKNRQPDSAIFYINQLLADTLEMNHPEIKFHLYDILGQIAEKKGDKEKAALNFKLALKKAEEYNATLTQVGSISSLIKIDDIENANNQKDEAFERERSLLIFTVLIALLTIIIIVIIYRNVKQKRHFENLLFAAKKEELAFINSHDVRKHLTNILGLVEVIRHSNNKEIEYLEAEDYLFKSAEYLDTAIKNISAKLDE